MFNDIDDSVADTFISDTSCSYFESTDLNNLKFPSTG